METRVITVDKAPIWIVKFDGDKTIFKSKPGGSYLRGQTVTGTVRGEAFMLGDDFGLRLVETALIEPPPVDPPPTVAIPKPTPAGTFVLSMPDGGQVVNRDEIVWVEK